MGRKLHHVRRDLLPLEKQGKVEGFLKNSENSGKLGSLVEDIRNAMMEYQVCITTRPFQALVTPASDLNTARDLRQELSAHREFNLLAVCSHGLNCG